MTEKGASTSTDTLKIPKSLRAVSLWVHPEGRVLGSLFLREHSCDHAGQENPSEVLNCKDDFVIIKRDDPDELRFYNKSSIIRVEYNEEQPLAEPDATEIKCQIYMMDGSLIDGLIKEVLPRAYSRLFDYINKTDNRFIRVYVTDTEVALINKSYVIRVTD